MTQVQDSQALPSYSLFWAYVCGKLNCQGYACPLRLNNKEDSIERCCLFFVRISVCVPSKPWCPQIVDICVVWQIVGHWGSTEIPLVPANHHCIDSVIFLRAPRFAGKSRMQSWGSSAKSLGLLGDLSCWHLCNNINSLVPKFKPFILKFRLLVLS